MNLAQVVKQIWHEDKEKLFKTLKYVTIGFGAYAFFGQEIGVFSGIKGPSMLPTFKESGDWVYLDKLTPCNSFLDSKYDYKHGDVVITKDPHDHHREVCKRIHAMEGDLVFDGKKFLRIVKGQVWLLGDNPAASRDSREYGPVPIGLLQGRIAYKFTSTYPYVHTIPRINSQEEPEEISDDEDLKNIYAMFNYRKSNEESGVNDEKSSKQVANGNDSSIKFLDLTTVSRVLGGDKKK